MKPLEFLGSSRDDLTAMPAGVRHDVGLELMRVQFGGQPVMSKKADPRFSDIRRARGSGNVFLDLGFDPAEAKVLALRAEVMIRLERHLKTQGWTQAETAKRLRITQPRVSRLIKGRWRDFSLDMLLTLAARAGLEPELRLAA
ncbi:MAG TPA: XRE family transcriptional regulator [Steroidobacteraceae bacterium]|nr:XRE family transcriptional regulator [Steroidobacteraceae bacterium]